MRISASVPRTRVNVSYPLRNPHENTSRRSPGNTSAPHISVSAPSAVHSASAIARDEVGLGIEQQARQPDRIAADVLDRAARQVRRTTGCCPGRPARSGTATGSRAPRRSCRRRASRAPVPSARGTGTRTPPTTGPPSRARRPGRARSPRRCRRAASRRRRPSPPRARRSSTPRAARSGAGCRRPRPRGRRSPRRIPRPRARRPAPPPRPARARCPGCPTDSATPSPVSRSAGRNALSAMPAVPRIPHLIGSPMSLTRGPYQVAGKGRHRDSVCSVDEQRPQRDSAGSASSSRSRSGTSHGCGSA